MRVRSDPAFGGLVSRPISCLVLSALVPLAACGSEDTSAPVAEVIDNAGVRLVLNRLPDGPLGTGGLALDAEPMLEIGAFEGDSLYQLYRVNGARRLTDGRLVVANAGTFEVRVYGADGRYQGAWGREGAGPGEFLEMSLVGAIGSDTSLVLDNRNRRISFMHPDEGFLGSVPLDDDVVGSPQAHGVFENGAVVLGGGPPRIVPRGDGLRSGANRPPAAFYSIARDGSVATDFGEHPGFEIFTWFRDGFISGATVLPFTRAPAAAVSADRLYMGTQDSYEIRAYDTSGSLTSIIRLDQEPRPVTSSDEAAYIERQLENIDDPVQLADRRSQIEDMGMPETMPAHGRLMADALGYLWVGEYRSPADATPTPITVFDAGGKLVGRLTFPDRFTVLEIGVDYVLGRYTDELDVEYLRLYRLRRGS